MVTVVYIDSVFLLNAVTDYLLILITARLAGVVLRPGWYLLPACAGGLYAVATYLPGLSFLNAVPVKCAAGVGLCLLAFGHEDALGRLTVLFFAVSCALAGAVTALNLFLDTHVTDARTFLCAAFAAWLLLAVLFRTAAKNHMSGTLLPVRLCVCGRTADLTALFDSGNALTDSGQSVLVLSPDILHSVFPPAAASLLTPQALRNPPELIEPLMLSVPSLRPRLLPYHAVGASAGLLLSVESDWADVSGLYYPRLRLALSPDVLGQGYSALWGGAIGKEARYGDGKHYAGNPSDTADASGSVPALHRRQ